MRIESYSAVKISMHAFIWTEIVQERVRGSSVPTIRFKASKGKLSGAGTPNKEDFQVGEIIDKFLVFNAVITNIQ